jgi:hypothetical protein
MEHDSCLVRLARSPLGLPALMALLSLLWVAALAVALEL